MAAASADEAPHRSFTPDELDALAQYGRLSALAVNRLISTTPSLFAPTPFVDLQPDDRVHTLDGTFKSITRLRSLTWQSEPDRFPHVRSATLFCFVSRLRRYEPDLTDAIVRFVGPFHGLMLRTETLRQCSALQHLALSKFVAKIADFALQQCEALEVVLLPRCIESIGKRAFERCKALRSISLPPSIKVVDKYAFAQSGLTEVDVSECRNLTCLFDGIFDHCTGLTTVTLPSTITMIGDDAFSRCASLASIRLPKSLTHIGEGAFRGTALVEVQCPRDLVHIGAGCFEQCPFLQRVVVGDGVYAILPSTFESCRELTEVVLPRTIVRVASQAFLGCTKLKQLSVPGWAAVEAGAVRKGTQLIRTTIPS